MEVILIGISSRFQNYTTPDPSYHGVVYADLGPVAFISKARAGILRDIGACQSPFNSWLFLQGLENSQPADGTTCAERSAGC